MKQRQFLAGALLLLVLTALTYAPLAAAGFVWDDKPLIEANTLTGSLANLPLFFQVDLWDTAGGVDADSGYYRPLMLTSLAVDRALWPSPAGHHLHSIAWHLLACGLLVALLRHLVAPLPALLAAALFALHPAQIEAVAWVAARNDLMVSALVFGSVLALHRDRLVLGGVLGLMALLCKESGVLAIALLFAVERGRPSWRKVVPLAVASLVWFGLRNGVAQVGHASVPGPEGLLYLLERLPQVGSHYARLLLLGFPLSVGGTLEYLRDPLSLVVVGWAALAVVCGLVVRRGGRLAVGGILFGLLSLAPAIVAIGVRGQLGDRYLYMPMAGAALALAASMSERRLMAALASPVLLLWVLLIGHRLPDWSDDLSLFASAVSTTPNGYSYANLGHEMNIRSRGVEACGLFREALRDDPPYVDVCANAVRCALRRGDLWEAALGASLTAQRCPRTPHQAGLEGLTWIQLCDLDAAREVVDAVPEVPDTRLPLVLAVLAIHDGDDHAYARIRASVPEPESFDEQVEQLRSKCP